MPAWLADRLQHLDDGGFRAIWELSKTLADPINLCVGQPDFPVAPAILAAATAALQAGHHGYTLAQGIAPLRELIRTDLDARHGAGGRDVIITPGTCGALDLLLRATVNPGDEVILFDPYFIAYPQLVGLVGGVAVVVDTYPDFQIDLDRVAAAITPRTKLILYGSPANPTGVVLRPELVRGLAALAEQHRLLLVSDEIYAEFCYDGPFISPASYYSGTVIVSSFSKTHALTGWRLGYAYGPAEVIAAMAEVQQPTFVCAPSLAQHAGLVAWTTEISQHRDAYRCKRDWLWQALDPVYREVLPGGAFYLFLRAPGGSGTRFVQTCLQNNLLVVPGRTFSRRDTHFRVSYAAADATLRRGVAVLNRLASG